MMMNGSCESQVNPRIAYVVGTYPAASETFVWREIEELRNRDWQVTVSCLHPASHPAEGIEGPDLIVYGRQLAFTVFFALVEMIAHPLAAIRVVASGIFDSINPGEQTSLFARCKYVLQAFASIGLAGRLRKYQVDRIHAQFAHSPASLAMYAAMQLGIPWSFTGHANDLFQRRALLKRKLARAEHIICISHWHKDFYRQILPESDSKLTVIRCGVDVPAKVDRRRFSSEKVNLVSVGRLVEKKGFTTLVSAFSLLHKAEPDRWRLTIAGDGPLASTLSKMVSELGCEDHIDLIGALHHSQVKTLMTKADIFVLPCCQDAAGDRDGIPVVLMEAMAAGLPVISGDLETIRELIENRETGLLVPSRQPGELAEAIRFLADNPSTVQKIADSGRKKIIEEFSTAGNIDKLIKLFRGANKDCGGQECK